MSEIDCVLFFFSYNQSYNLGRQAHTSAGLGRLGQDNLSQKANEVTHALGGVIPSPDSTQLPCRALRRCTADSDSVSHKRRAFAPSPAMQSPHDCFSYKTVCLLNKACIGSSGILLKRLIILVDDRHCEQDTRTRTDGTSEIRSD